MDPRTLCQRSKLSAANRGIRNFTQPLDAANDTVSADSSVERRKTDFFVVDMVKNAPASASYRFATHRHAEPPYFYRRPDRLANEVDLAEHAPDSSPGGSGLSQPSSRVLCL